MKNPLIKKIICIFAALAILLAFGLCAIASGESEDDQGADDASGNNGGSNLGDYNVVIESCRIAKNYEGKPIAIIKYSFTNNDEEAACFAWSIDDAVYQNGVGLNECYFADDSANYSADNQTKEIKKGATLAVEVAYMLNDETTDLDVEVKELISFNDKIVKKTFKLN